MPRSGRPTPFRVALVGKGGSGKSVIAGTLARALARRGHRVLALDSDPMPGLAFSLGVRAGGEPMLDGYATRGDDGEWRIVRNLKPATVVRRAAMEGPDGVLFLQFGKVDTPTLAPLMSSLQAFWGIANDLPRTPWTIVHDLPAGTRQAFSGWGGDADVFLIVVEPTQKSILSARRLAGITDLADGAKVGLIANKVRDEDDELLIVRSIRGVEMVGSVPYDPDVAEADGRGLPPIDHAPLSAGVRAVESISERLESLTRRDP